VASVNLSVTNLVMVTLLAGVGFMVARAVSKALGLNSIAANIPS